MVRQVIFFCGFIVFFSCNKAVKNDVVNLSKQELRVSEYQLIDSVEINSKKNYEFYYFTNQNSFYACTYPDLDLEELDFKANILHKVTKGGEAPGELSQMVRVAKANDKLFVLECANYYRCFVFDTKTKQYITTILFDDFGATMSPSIMVGSFDVTFENDNYILTFSGESNIISPNEAKYYKEVNAISQYVVDTTYKAISYKEFLPYNKFTSLQNKVKNNKKSWDHSVLSFAKQNDKYYVMPFFSDSVFVYDKTWKLEEKKEVLNKNNNKGFTTAFTPIKNTGDRLKRDFLLRFTNRNIYSIEVYNDKLFLLYPKPVAQEKAPTDMVSYNNFVPKTNLQIIDLKEKQQYLIELPKKTAYFSGMKIVNDSTFILPSNPMFQDKRYLYTIKYSVR